MSPSSRARSAQSPPSHREPSVRRLSAGTSGERPIRAPLVVGFALVLALVAVPLYLLRRPGGSALPTRTDSSRSGFGGVIRAEPDAGAWASDVLLGPLQRVRCGASPNQTSGEGGLCDALPLLEGALRQSIQSNVDCAPRADKEGSINYVLEVDFSSNRLNVFAGQSGSWRGSRARKAVTCVLRSLPPLPWVDVAHQHQYYAIAILATYPAADSSDGLPSFD
jgi:hypothetical protein